MSEVFPRPCDSREEQLTEVARCLVVGRWQRYDQHFQELYVYPRDPSTVPPEMRHEPFRRLPQGDGWAFSTVFFPVASTIDSWTGPAWDTTTETIAWLVLLRGGYYFECPDAHSP